MAMTSSERYEIHCVAGAVPLLSSAVWFYLAATSVELEGTGFEVTAAACAAQLAEQVQPGDCLGNSLVHICVRLSLVTDRVHLSVRLSLVTVYP